MGRLAASVAEADGQVACPLGDAPADVAALLLHLLHDVEHHVLDVRRGLAALAIAASSPEYPVES